MKRLALGLGLGVVLVVALARVTAAADGFPTFTVSGQYQTNVALLVPKDASNAQLKALILALRKARQDNALSKFFPPTTPKGSAGPYGIVVVYVYSDPAWATSASLKRCTTDVRGDTPAYADCSRPIRAYYLFGAAPANEEGTVGYAEGKRVYTKHYEKLF